MRELSESLTMGLCVYISAPLCACVSLSLSVSLICISLCGSHIHGGEKESRRAWREGSREGATSGGKLACSGFGL